MNMQDARDVFEERKIYKASIKAFEMELELKGDKITEQAMGISILKKETK